MEKWSERVRSKERERSQSTETKDKEKVIRAIKENPYVCSANENSILLRSSVTRKPLPYRELGQTGLCDQDRALIHPRTDWDRAQQRRDMHGMGARWLPRHSRCHLLTLAKPSWSSSNRNNLVRNLQDKLCGNQMLQARMERSGESLGRRGDANQE
jgi:hypothetical protein